VNTISFKVVTSSCSISFFFIRSSENAFWSLSGDVAHQQVIAKKERKKTRKCINESRMGFGPLT
jgi:hypothetical protein